jgi:hypothetical protein
MILRRVIAHVRRQEWTAIAIDFVIVVIGVVVGIQVSNWNEEFETRKKAEIYTARLMSDLANEAFGYQALIEYLGDVLDNAERAIDSLTGDAVLSDEQFLISAYRASMYAFAERQRATFDELISTGEIGLIADLKLRQTAIFIYNTPTFALITESGRDSEFREIFRKTVPAKIQRALLKNCGDRSSIPGDYESLTNQLDYECALDLPAAVISGAAQTLRSDPAFLPALQIKFADTETALYLLQETPGEMYDNLREIGGSGRRAD